MVGAEGLDALEAEALVQFDRFDLMNPSFQAEQVDAALAAIVGQMPQHEFAQTQAAEWRGGANQLVFGVPIPVFLAHEEEAAPCGRRGGGPRAEEANASLSPVLLDLYPAGLSRP